ncbi:MAG: sigma-70 family RNA polymerase sigma factor [Steroidobacterales bacterium]
MSEAVESDEALMLRYAAGDVRAFEQLYLRHEMKVWRFIYRSVCNQATADELMQDVWFAVVQAAARYQPSARFTTWLFTLAQHRLIDRHRRSKPLDHELAHEQGDRRIEQLAAPASADPSHQAQSLQHADALLSAVEQLPPEQRAAFLMQAEGELSVEEIAAATGVSFETAKSRLRYARTRLQQILQEYV